jgi:MerR family transcriptional regulator, light-induced transcriptional regulator
MNTIELLSDKPKYSIKTVCAQTGVMAVTLRAWERRYNLLSPYRTESNYRLYSERDVAVLRWLKNRVDNGLSISNAAAEWAEMRLKGQWPTPPPLLETQRSVTQSPTPPSQYAERLYNALIPFNEEAATVVLVEAHAIFNLITVCLDVITPCLINIGDAWHRGDIRISSEHLATNYLHGRLTTLYQSFPSRRSAARIIIANPPSESHEIGNLMLATLLRRDGYRVDYLGTGIPSEDLIEYIRSEKPAMVCFSASSEEAVHELKALHQGIAGTRSPIYFGYGGRIFMTHSKLRESTPGIFLGDNIRDGYTRIEQLLN